MARKMDQVERTVRQRLLLGELVQLLREKKEAKLEIEAQKDDAGGELSELLRIKAEVKMSLHSLAVSGRLPDKTSARILRKEAIGGEIDKLLDIYAGLEFEHLLEESGGDLHFVTK